MSSNPWRWFPPTALTVLILTAARPGAPAPATPDFSQPLIPVSPVANPCPRFDPGSVVQAPPSLTSRHGVLQVDFSYQTRTDAAGRQLFCYMTPSGLENPTLEINPGDHLIIKITNNTPATAPMMTLQPPTCGAKVMTASSVNIHFHGTNTSPDCHADEVIRTTINSGQTFRYDVAFPANEPPGVYWYHPHIHGLAENAVLGGASGAIVVSGIEHLQPAVVGLPQRLLILRDQNVPGTPNPQGNVPSWDVTLNNVPITSPTDPAGTDFVPAVIQMEAGKTEFWRISNSASDTIADLQLEFDGVPQTLQLVAIDAVPVNSQNGARTGPTIPVTHFRLPPAARVEFIAPAPTATTKVAQLVTLGINTGPSGDNDPQRPLANLELSGAGALGVRAAPAPEPSPGGSQQRFAGLATATVTAQRTLYFSEDNPTQRFFITVDGQTPTLFSPDNPPAVVTTQGAVEDWTIENRALENHEFHFHQIHFLVLSQDHFEDNGSQPAPGLVGQLADMIEVPFWDGVHAFPSVTVRMDFRGPDIGDFVYHCHILNHEDHGMMAIIRVRPRGSAAATGGDRDRVAPSPQGVERRVHHMTPQ
jgi:FtsP/CotA-like multicopper oxidase with cupredoxin domain